MAERWDGLLLIDEADIYLQQREIGQSLERETIVAGKSPHPREAPIGTDFRTSFSSNS